MVQIQQTYGALILRYGSFSVQIKRIVFRKRKIFNFPVSTLFSFDKENKTIFFAERVESGVRWGTLIVRSIMCYLKDTLFQWGKAAEEKLAVIRFHWENIIELKVNYPLLS